MENGSLYINGQIANDQSAAEPKLYSLFCSTSFTNKAQQWTHTNKAQFNSIPQLISWTWNNSVVELRLFITVLLIWWIYSWLSSIYPFTEWPEQFNTTDRTQIQGYPAARREASHGHSRTIVIKLELSPSDFPLCLEKVTSRVGLDYFSSPQASQ